MKYRKSHQKRVLYDLSGRRQEEIEQYQGFMEVAGREGWEVFPVSEQFEQQVRTLLSRNWVDAIAGNFVSARWAATLRDVTCVHVGMQSLGGVFSSVHWDWIAIGQLLKEHLMEQGYSEICLFSPQPPRDLIQALEPESIFKTRESLREALLQMTDVGVVTSTDFEARRVMRLCREIGKSVPDAVGISGVGNRSLDQLLSEFTFTTVSLPYREKGIRAGEVLADGLQGAVSESVAIAPLQCIPRMSTQRNLNHTPLGKQVDELILSALGAPQEVEDWAKAAGMSRRGYERAFAREQGVTPYEYLLRQREQEVRRLLSETRWSVARIGEAVGIPDPPRFSAFCKKRLGMSASEWRKENVKS